MSKTVAERAEMQFHGYRGIPVVGKEWEELPDGVLAIHVDSYQNGRPGKVLSVMRVGKRNGKPLRGAMLYISPPPSGPTEVVISAN